MTLEAPGFKSCIADASPATRQVEACRTSNTLLRWQPLALVTAQPPTHPTLNTLFTSRLQSQRRNIVSQSVQISRQQSRGSTHEASIPRLVREANNDRAQLAPHYSSRKLLQTTRRYGLILRATMGVHLHTRPDADPAGCDKRLVRRASSAPLRLATRDL